MADILQLAAQGNAKDVLRDIRVRSLYSSYYFTKTVLGFTKLSKGFHLPEMDRFIDNWATGIRKQAIEWSRGFYKTTCFTISTAIWVTLPVTDEDIEYAISHLGISEGEWQFRAQLHDQDATQLLVFETEDNASRKIREIKWHFEENSLFRTLFPEIAYDGKQRPWNDTSLRIPRVGLRKHAAEGTFDAIGVGGALQSRHYKIIWEDDVVGEKARKSPVVMQDTISWHGRLNGAYENATEQIRFLVSNRWGYADLNSYVREHEPDVAFHTRSAIERDSEGKDVAVFPEEYPLEKLLAIKQSTSITLYDFSCQYLNDPQMPGQREIDTKRLHTYRVGSGGVIECSCGVSFRPSQLNRYLHYDPFNAKPGSVSCPCLVVPATAPDGHIFLLDFYLGKENYDRVYDRMFFFNDTWRPCLFTYEDVGHQNMTEFHIRKIQNTEEYKKARHIRFPRILGVTTGGRSKEARIREGLFPHIEKGKFSYRTTQQTFVQMLERFPHRCLDHDYDLLDALAQGNGLWEFPISMDEREKETEAEDEYLRHFNQPYAVGVRT